jgi:hypothetical protein
LKAPGTGAEPLFADGNGMNILSQPFVKAVLDPTLIPGIFNACDQWCMYCPATARCLAYRCRPPGAKEEDPQDIYANIASRMLEGVQLLRNLNRAEGREIPELEMLMSKDPREQLCFPVVDDPLERMGRRYGKLTDAYLLSRPDFPFVMKPRPEGPTAYEVLAWYHQLIPSKIYRALASRAAAVRGEPFGDADARASAKTALIGIDRSRAAIQDMRQEDDDVRLDEIGAHLRRVARELEGRFPDARSFVRVGLDSVSR